MGGTKSYVGRMITEGGEHAVPKMAGLVAPMARWYLPAG